MKKEFAISGEFLFLCPVSLINLQYVKIRLTLGCICHVEQSETSVGILRKSPTFPK